MLMTGYLRDVLAALRMVMPWHAVLDSELVAQKYTWQAPLMNLVPCMARFSDGALSLQWRARAASDQSLCACTAVMPTPFVTCPHRRTPSVRPAVCENACPAPTLVDVCWTTCALRPVPCMHHRTPEELLTAPVPCDAGPCH
jgi:hypothetical protein